MNNLLLRLFVVALCISASGSLSAQPAENLRFERFTIENGLASNWVTAITQDTDGYIWVGTASGLSRFDGYDFVTYRNIPGNPHSLSNNRVNVLHVDPSGLIWVGTQNGLSRFDPVNGDFLNYYHRPGNPASLPGNSISAIHETASGKLWIGTDQGLAELDPETGSVISEWSSPANANSLTGVTISSISADQDGLLWIGSRNRGLITFDSHTKTPRFLSDENPTVATFPSRNVSKVKVSSTGDIWVGFMPNHGLMRYHPTTATSVFYQYHKKDQPEFWNVISDIMESEDQTIWVTTYNQSAYMGLHKFNEKTGLFTRYTYQPNNPTSLTWGYCESVFEDKDNNLWVGTSRGLNKADRNRWQMGMMNVDPDNPFDFVNNFYAIEEVKEDVLWLGLDGTGFIEWDRKANIKKKIERTDPRSGDGRVFAIRKDLDGNVWFGYRGQGCARYHPKTGKLEKFINEPGNPESLIGNIVSDILIDRKNTVWIATSSGLSRYNRTTGTFTNWQADGSPEGLSGNSLFSLFEDSRGAIWIGTREMQYDPRATFPSGLIKYDPETNRFRTYRNAPGDPGSLSSDAVYCVNEDPDGNIWVGTNNGLNKLDSAGNQFTVFHDADGLPDPNIVGILVDHKGLLWLSTLKGISRFDPVKKSFRNFTMEDGIQAYRFNDNSRFKTSRGELIFGGVAGINLINPSGISGEKVIPKVLITRFLKQNMPVRFEKTASQTATIDLAWDDNSIGFEFVAINYRSAQQTRYEYKLEGLENEWIQAGTRRYVNYTHLPAGNYTFRVRAVNAEGVYSDTDAVMEIRITPPFWRTWWAYSIYAFLFFGAVFLIDRYQRQRLVRLEREKVRDREIEQAREIEKAYTTLKSTQAQLIQFEKMASLGELTAGIAHEIQNPLNFVNNFSEISNELMEEMQSELEKGDLEEAKALSADIRINLEKISHHGKRASGIVKGMLEHSRSATGERTLTDVNTLAEEYLRLSFHGLRAKDKSFNAEFRTDLDASLPAMNLVAQDIGRVLLNIINNAFYAVHEKSKAGKEGYKPVVTVQTRLKTNHFEIRISDNGKGIPGEIRDKIFQPFFTTKPTGQGTGLGLSLSYDIVKAHGGEIKLETREGEGTTFTIMLPVR